MNKTFSSFKLVEDGGGLMGGWRQSVQNAKNAEEKSFSMLNGMSLTKIVTAMSEYLEKLNTEIDTKGKAEPKAMGGPNGKVMFKTTPNDLSVQAKVLSVLNNMTKYMGKALSMVTAKGYGDVKFGANAPTYALGVSCALAVYAVYNIVKWIKNRKKSESTMDDVKELNTVIQESNTRYNSYIKKLTEAENVSTGIIDKAQAKAREILDWLKPTSDDSDGFVGWLRRNKNWVGLLSGICVVTLGVYGLKKNGNVMPSKLNPADPVGTKTFPVSGAK